MSMNELDCKVQELRELNAMIAELTAEADSLKDLIKQKMVDEGTEVLKGAGWNSTWKSVTSSRFDGKAFKEDFPELYAKYSKTTTAPRFTLSV